MTYEQFIEQVKWEVEDIARESFDDVRTVVRTVTKNNNVRRKTISIFKEGQLATPTIYLRDYYLDYKKGRSIENIGREIFMIYSEGTKRFTFDVNQFSDFSKVKDKIYYKLVNYEMNRQALKTMPHFKFLDMAIVFFVSIMGNEKEQGTIAIQNAYVEKWGISKEELRRTAINNTWKEYPPEIKKMEDIISEIVLGQVTSEDDDEDGLISEEISYGEFSIDNVRQMIKEEVDKMRAQAEMDMYVLTNTSRNFGAACITYPGVLKEFAPRQRRAEVARPAVDHVAHHQQHEHAGEVAFFPACRAFFRREEKSRDARRGECDLLDEAEAGAAQDGKTVEHGGRCGNQQQEIPGLAREFEFHIVPPARRKGAGSPSVFGIFQIL